MSENNEKPQSWQEAILNYLKSITASIVYEDPYDYSKGVKGAEVDYIPETVEELISEVPELNYLTMIIDNKQSNTVEKDYINVLEHRISQSEAKCKKQEEALREIANIKPIRESYDVASGFNLGVTKCQIIATEA